MQGGQGSAIQRLFRDYRECLANPLPTVAAGPLNEKDFMKWHGNVSGPIGSPFFGHYFHIEIEFPPNYPSTSPRIRLLTQLHHKNVIGTWICLDMLENEWVADRYDQRGTDMFTGWSSAYSVQSILIQLQAFLFEKDRVYALQPSLDSAKRYVCDLCKHTNENPHPAPIIREEDDFDDSDDEKLDVLTKKPKPKSRKRNNRRNRPHSAASQSSLSSQSDAMSLPSDSSSTNTHSSSTNTPQTSTQKKKRKRKRKNRNIIRSPQSNKEESAPPVKDAFGGDLSLQSDDLLISGELPKIQKPKTGKKLVGIVTSVEKKGVYVDVGWTADGFLSLNDVKGYVGDGRKIFDLQQRIIVWIKQVIHEKSLAKSFTVTMRGKRPRLLSDLKNGEILTGEIVALLNYGALVSIDAEQDAFIHKSQMGQVVWQIQDILAVGDSVKVKILGIDVKGKKVWLRLLDKQSLSILTSEESKENCSEVDSILSKDFGIVPDDVLYTIFTFLPISSIGTVRKLCPLFERIIGRRVDMNRIRSELVCSKISYSTEILGLGMSIKHYPRNQYTNKVGPIESITPTLDLLGYSAYHYRGQRVGVWKEPFTNWLPLYLCPSHGRRALPLALTSIDQMFAGAGTDVTSVLEILPKLLNTMVVNTMEGSLHESIRALQGYCYFYHLLLALCEDNSNVRKTADQRIQTFLDGESGRSKKSVQSLGQWITYLSISDHFSWNDPEVSVRFLEECFDRNVKWIVKDHPRVYNRLTSDDVRLRIIFSKTEVSRGLIMFHVLFLKTLRFDPYICGGKKYLTTSEVKSRLDRTFGRPDYQMESIIQNGIKSIKAVSSWDQFFQMLDVTAPSKSYMNQWLCQSFRNSERRGYHRNLRY